MRSNSRRLAVIVVCATVALAITGCGNEDDDRVQPQAGGAALTAAVQVEASGCGNTASLGAGSFLAEERVLTVAHVVAGSHTVHVVLANGKRVEATVVAIDRSKDLAVLAVDAHLSPLKLGSMRRGSTGTFVVYRNGTAMPLAFEAVAAVELNVASIDGDGSSVRSGYQLKANVEQGDSGSVLVVDGVATGVVFARSTSTGGKAWAIDIAEASDLLARRDVAPVDVGACVDQG